VTTRSLLEEHRQLQRALALIGMGARLRPCALPAGPAGVIARLLAEQERGEGVGDGALSDPFRSVEQVGVCRATTSGRSEAPSNLAVPDEVAELHREPNRSSAAARTRACVASTVAVESRIR